MATASSERNKVLGITLQGYDKLGPATKTALQGVKALEAGAIAAFKAITFPVSVLHRTITALLSPIGLLRAAMAFLAARGAIRFFTEAADDLDIIDKLNLKLGISTDSLQRFRAVAEVADVSLDALGQSFLQMENRISEAARGAGEGAAALKTLGLSAIELQRLAPENQFLAIRDALARVERQTDRVNLTLDLFGRGGAEMLKIFRMSREEFDRIASSVFIFSREEISRAVQFNDEITLLKATWRDLRIIVAGEFFPTIQRGVAGLRDFIRNHLPALKSFVKDVAFYTELSIRGAVEFINFWRQWDPRTQAASLRTVFDLVVDMTGSALDAAGQLVIRAVGNIGGRVLTIARDFSDTLGRETALGIVRGLVKLPVYISEVLNDALLQLNSFRLPIGPGPGMIGGMLQKLIDDLAPIQSAMNTALKMKIDVWLPPTSDAELQARYELFGQKVGTQFSEGWKKATEDLLSVGSTAFRDMDAHVEAFVQAWGHLAALNPSVAELLRKLQMLPASIRAAAEEAKRAGQAAKDAAGSVNLFGAAYGQFNQRSRDFIDALRDVGEATKEAKRLGDEAFTQMSSSFMGTMDGMIDSAIAGTLNITKSFRDMAKEMLAIAAKLFVRLAAMQLVNSFFQIPGPTGPALAAMGPVAAKGIVLDRGNVKAFAAGGVVNGPTLFPMRHGFGLMGEAGPEAIMPLGRDHRGRLGIRTTDAERAAPEVNVNINIVAADTKDFDRLLHERRSQIKSIIMEAMAHHNDMRSAIRGLVR